MRNGLLRWGPVLGAGYLRLVGLTSRFEHRGRQPVDAVRAEGPVVWAFWHNRLLGPVVPYRGQGIGVVISRSRDGELIAAAVQRFGYVPLRGSSSRGGVAALKAALDHLGRGHDVAFTPDGPRGPRYRVQPGVVVAARRSGAPIVPVGIGFSRRAVFRSWDRFQVPLPFGRIHYVYGRPLRVAPGDDLRGACRILEAELVRLTERADARAGVVSP